MLNTRVLHARVRASDHLGSTHPLRHRCRAHQPSVPPPPVPPPRYPLCATAQLRVACELPATSEHTGDLHAPMSLHSSKRQGDVCAERACCKRTFQVYQMYVASVFFIDVVKIDRVVAKVDHDVAYVAMAIHVCFKYTYVASVLSRCCKSRSGCCIYIYTCCKRMF
jgi:hypothetical protein